MPTVGKGVQLVILGVQIVKCIALALAFPDLKVEFIVEIWECARSARGNINTVSARRASLLPDDVVVYVRTYLLVNNQAQHKNITNLPIQHTSTIFPFPPSLGQDRLCFNVTTSLIMARNFIVAASFTTVLPSCSNNDLMIERGTLTKELRELIGRY